MTCLPFSFLNVESNLIEQVRQRVERKYERLDGSRGQPDRALLQRTILCFPFATDGRGYDLVDDADGRLVGVVEAAVRRSTVKSLRYLCAAFEGASVTEALLEGRREGEARLYHCGTLIGTVVSSVDEIDHRRRRKWLLQCGSEQFGEIRFGGRVGPGPIIIQRPSGEELPVHLQMERSFVDFVKVLANLLSLAWIVKAQPFRVSRSYVIPPRQGAYLDDSEFDYYFAVQLLFRMIVYPFDFVLRE